MGYAKKACVKCSTSNGEQKSYDNKEYINNGADKRWKLEAEGQKCDKTKLDFVTTTADDWGKCGIMCAEKYSPTGLGCSSFGFNLSTKECQLFPPCAKSTNYETAANWIMFTIENICGYSPESLNELATDYSNTATKKAL